MPKNLKLNLNELKVQSFVTALSTSEKIRIKGGGPEAYKTLIGPSCIECTFTCGTNCSCGTDCNTCSPSWCSGNEGCC